MIKKTNPSRRHFSFKEKHKSKVRFPGLAGDPNGISVTDLIENGALLEELANQQASILHEMGKDPDSEEESSPQVIRFGHLQHKQLKPMYGRSGPKEFRIARDVWNRLVRSKLRALRDTDSYVSPFDGQLK